MPDLLVINTSYIIKINANCFVTGCDLVACPSPGASTFLIKIGGTCLIWLRQQPTLRIYFL